MLEFMFPAPDADRKLGTHRAVSAVVLLRESPYTLAMGEHTAIEWTEATWNPTSGCTKVSPGCDRCYAERIAL